mgnify:CR=1 FL=1
MRPRLTNIGIVVASILTALGVCEGVLRARGSYPPPETPIRTARPDLYRADPHVGYTLWPATTTTYRYPQTSDTSIPLVSNSDGFRGSREFDERDGRVRVLVVGDSFVFGQGVRAEERVTEQLEALEPRWQQNRNRYDLHTALLDRYLEHAAALSFRPTVAFLPGLGDTEEDRQRRAFLAEWAAANGVPFADLTETMHGAGVDKVYIQDNWHWNPLGHRIAARELHGLVRRRLDQS